MSFTRCVLASDTSGQVPSHQCGVQVQAGSGEANNAHYCRDTGEGRVLVFNVGGPPPPAHQHGSASALFHRKFRVQRLLL